MPKKAPQTDTVDPVRSRLAGAVAGPTPKLAATPIDPTPHENQVEPEPQPDAVTSPPPERPRKPTAKASAMTINRKFMVSPQEAEQIEQTLKLLKEAFKCKITLSQATRALWAILAGSEDVMRGVGRRYQPRTGPSTGNALAMAEHEEEVAEFLEEILKRS